MLAKNVNDNACFLNERGACKFFASKLAPTEGKPLPVQVVDIYGQVGVKQCPKPYRL